MSRKWNNHRDQHNSELDTEEVLLTKEDIEGHVEPEVPVEDSEPVAESEVTENENTENESVETEPVENDGVAENEPAESDTTVDTESNDADDVAVQLVKDVILSIHNGKTNSATGRVQPEDIVKLHYKLYTLMMSVLREKNYKLFTRKWDIINDAFIQYGDSSFSILSLCLHDNLWTYGEDTLGQYLKLVMGVDVLKTPATRKRNLESQSFSIDLVLDSELATEQQIHNFKTYYLS